MKHSFKVGRLGRLVLAASVVGLVACSSPTEKAQGYFEKGKVLLEKGDLAKATLEFKNALQITGNMVPAWYAMAEIAERKGEWEPMYGYLMKVVELDAKHLEAQLKLGRLLVAAGQLDKALATSDKIKALAPDNSVGLALRAAILYKLDDKKAAVQLANASLEKSPNNIDALVVLATERIAAGDAVKAIEFLDQGLKLDEKNIAMQLIKVQALEKLSKVDSAEQIFKRLIEFYPSEKAFRHILAQFYMSHGDKVKAEAEYRAVAAANPKDNLAKIDVVRFVHSVSGAKSAIAELQKMIAAEPENYDFRFALASIQQGQNDRKAADATLQEIISKAGDTPDGIKARGVLAGTLLAAGKKDEANKLITEILAKDARNEQGMILRAGLAIDDRRLEEAIGDLRTVLRDVPNSARALSLLARAHELAGSKDLADDHYMRAFQVSKLAAPYGMSYAAYLMKQGKPKQAEGILKDVLRASPGNLPALKMLAQVYLASGNFAGAQAVADETSRLKDQGVLANQIQGALFAAKKNYENSISSFKKAYELSPSEVQPMVALVRTYLRAGKPKEALGFMSSVVQAAPDNVDARLLLGQLSALTGNKEQAAEAFQAVIEKAPKSTAGYLNMANLRVADKRFADAEIVIGQGLVAIPNDFGLRVTRAGILELEGKIDEAIALYESLLKERPTADVLVNNLASLLSEYRTDKESLKRAHDLAQRLKNSDIPQFKDTLGWTSYKVGKYDEASSLLASAVDQMPDMAVLHYHYGMNHLALANKDAARKALQKSIDMAKDQPFPQLELAKKTLQGL